MRLFNRFTCSLLSLLVPALVHAADAASAGIQIIDAWIAEAPPVSSVNAAYMKVINSTPAEIDIVSTSCANYSSAEFHRTVNSDGMVRMQRLDKLEIPAGSTLAIEPGSYHIMLFNPARALYSGDSIQCTLTLNSGNTITIKLDVRKLSEAHPDNRN